MFNIQIKLYKLHIILLKSELSHPQPQKAGEHLGSSRTGQSASQGRSLQPLLGTGHWLSHYCALNLTVQSKRCLSLSWTEVDEKGKGKKGKKKSHLKIPHHNLKKKIKKKMKERKNPKQTKRTTLFQNKQRIERKVLILLANHIHLDPRYPLTTVISQYAGHI